MTGGGGIISSSVQIWSVTGVSFFQNSYQLFLPSLRQPTTSELAAMAVSKTPAKRSRLLIMAPFLLFPNRPPWLGQSEAFFAGKS